VEQRQQQKLDICKILETRILYRLLRPGPHQPRLIGRWPRNAIHRQKKDLPPQPIAIKIAMNPDQKPEYTRVYIPIENAKVERLLELSAAIGRTPPSPSQRRSRLGKFTERFHLRGLGWLILSHPNVGAYGFVLRRISLVILSLLLCSCTGFSSPPGEPAHNRCSRPGSGDIE
jgi:hypothetical protein